MWKDLNTNTKYSESIILIVFKYQKYLNIL